MQTVCRNDQNDSRVSSTSLGCEAVTNGNHMKPSFVAVVSRARTWRSQETSQASRLARACLDQHEGSPGKAWKVCRLRVGANPVFAGKPSIHDAEESSPDPRGLPHRSQHLPAPSEENARESGSSYSCLEREYASEDASVKRAPPRSAESARTACTADSGSARRKRRESEIGARDSRSPRRPWNCHHLVWRLDLPDGPAEWRLPEGVRWSMWEWRILGIWLRGEHRPLAF